MFEFDISYKSNTFGRKGERKRVSVKGPEKVREATLEDIFDFIVYNHIRIDQEVTEALQRDGLFPTDENDYAEFVDGKRDKPVEKLKPFGKIVKTRKIEEFGPVIIKAFQMLAVRQVADSGYYRGNNWLIYNDQVVAKGIFSANAWIKTAEFKNGDHIRIVNMSPYARKLEREGKKVSQAKKSKGERSNTKRKKKSFTGGEALAANGAFWQTKNALRNRYPVLRDTIRFSFIPISGGTASRLNSKSFSRYNFRKDGRPYLYPSISFKIGGGNNISGNKGLTEPQGKL